MKEILLTSSSPGDATASTHVEGDGVTTILMQANLIFQRSLDFHLSKCFGVYSQNSKNCKFPCIAFINRLEKNEKNSFIQHEHKKKPYKDRSLSISATVCLQKLHQERVCRESNQSCLWFTTLIPTSSQGIRDHCLWNCGSLSEPTASPHSLTKTGFPSTVVYLPHFLLLQAMGSPQNSLHLPKKLALCEAQQPDWAQTEFCEELKGQQQ